MMREFIYFSSKAKTSGNFGDNLMEAGRMDIACHVLINTFFLSHKLREDVKLHMIFYGAPDPPKHLEFEPSRRLGDSENKIDISKKDVAGLIRRMLYKYKEGRKNEIAPGYWIEKKSLFAVIDELEEGGRTVYILDDKGEDIRDIEISKDCVFLLGDHEGLPGKELKRLKKICVPVSVGPRVLFASQVVTIVSNELDRRGI
jgi:tRNA (pseudouridine54-N1)-methyltransferase